MCEAELLYPGSSQTISSLTMFHCACEVRVSSLPVKMRQSWSTHGLLLLATIVDIGKQNVVQAANQLVACLHAGLSLQLTIECTSENCLNACPNLFSLGRSRTMTKLCGWLRLLQNCSQSEGH